jgi:hypothetical protein
MLGAARAPANGKHAAPRRTIARIRITVDNASTRPSSHGLDGDVLGVGDRRPDRGLQGADPPGLVLARGEADLEADAVSAHQMVAVGKAIIQMGTAMKSLRSMNLKCTDNSSNDGCPQITAI